MGLPLSPLCYRLQGKPCADGFPMHKDNQWRVDEQVECADNRIKEVVFYACRGTCRQEILPQQVQKFASEFHRPVVYLILIEVSYRRISKFQGAQPAHDETNSYRTSKEREPIRIGVT